MCNPNDDTFDCHYCNAKGCMCPGLPGVHLDDCQPCGPCNGDGQLTRRELLEMAEHYRNEEKFKRAWKSSGT